MRVGEESYDGTVVPSVCFPDWENLQGWPRLASESALHPMQSY